MTEMEKLQQEIILLRQALAEADRGAGEQARINRQIMAIVQDMQREKNELVKEIDKLMKADKAKGNTCLTQDSEESTSTPSETIPSEQSLPS